ncbi:MAG: hypothetical protein OEU32_14900 [Acidimicrobiia bacterium]|nr:hypothetical protein [Acidimicrobiia bacterium]
MGSLLFLAIALGIFVLGSLLLWWRSRERRSFNSSIDDFEANMGALAPDARERSKRRR